MFTSHDEILTGNSRGMIKLWDVRTNSGKPVHSSSLAEDSEVFQTNLGVFNRFPINVILFQVGVSSMDRHPFQGHVIAVGSYDGMLAICT